jgi:hypothetical protein
MFTEYFLNKARQRQRQKWRTSFGVTLLAPGQHYRKYAAASRLGFNRNRASMRLDASLAERKSQSGP